MACSTDPPTSPNDLGDAASNAPDGGAPSADARPPDPTTCNGCVRGALGASGDAVTLSAVTGLVDGEDDQVTVEGTFRLESAATATLSVTCRGASSGLGARQTVAAPPAGQTARFSVAVHFERCAADVVTVALSKRGAAGDADHVRCCFLRGRDF